LAIWMLKEADLKVYLLASEELRASRILNREGGDLEEIKRFTAMRDAEDTKRYKNLYGIDNTDYSSADLIIDTSKHLPEDIANIILNELEKRGLVEKA
ncbi:MAG: cytidylate kinase family protein, partial [Treponema sp.]|nr:cytidylate kinase family protein [Treponema sp.]MBQ2463934.1 cytidylate kinase family protein [Treponema sp.]